MNKLLRYESRSTELSTAIDEMADWLAQQLVLVGANKVELIRVCCSKQHMDLRSYQQQLPQFKQRLLARCQLELQFAPVQSGPHVIEMEIKQMSGSWLGKALGGLKDMFSEQEGEQAATKVSAPAASAQVNIQTEVHRYDPIRQGIELACRQLLQTVRAHVAIAPEDVLVLRQVKVRGVDEDSKILLMDFEREFGAAQRSKYIQKLLQDQKASNNVLLQDLSVEIVRDKADSPLDAFECVTQALNRNEILSGVDVQLFGEWELREVPVVAPAPVAPVAPPAQATPVVMPVVNDAITVVLKIFDGQTPAGRECSVQNFPMSLGKSAALPIIGQFVSSTHALLDWSESTGLTWNDSSTNGSWLNNAAERMVKNVPQRLAVGDKIRLAASLADAKDLSAAPRIEVLNIITPNAAVGATPVIMPTTNQFTPVIQAAPLILARLLIKDADGSRELPIMSCPFAIGRAQDQQYIVPQANLNVSGKHLLISAIHANGAKVEHLAHAKNGSAKASRLQDKLPAEFDWAFDEELVLAPRDVERPVVLKLLRA